MNRNMRNVIAGLSMVGLLFFMGIRGYAQSAGAQGAKQRVDVGNKFCPVSGDPVSGQTFVEYDGKRYGLCCADCTAPFLKSPDKYIKKMEMQEAMPQHQQGGMHGGQGMMPSDMEMTDDDDVTDEPDDMGHLGPR